MHAVNHAFPVCDNFCRCPRCKPNLQTRALARLKVSLVIGLALAIALLVFA